MDLVYLGIVFGFFALSWGLIVLCEQLRGESADAARSAGRHRA